jgi:hypothetical protein
MEFTSDPHARVDVIDVKAIINACLAVRELARTNSDVSPGDFVLQRRFVRRFRSWRNGKRARARAPRARR